MSSRRLKTDAMEPADSTDDFCWEESRETPSTSAAGIEWKVAEVLPRERGSGVDHSLVHQSGMGFKCEICEKVLKSSKTLIRHVHFVHETWAERFMCEICEKYSLTK